MTQTSSTEWELSLIVMGEVDTAWRNQFPFKPNYNTFIKLISSLRAKEYFHEHLKNCPDSDEKRSKVLSFAREMQVKTKRTVRGYKDSATVTAMIGAPPSAIAFAVGLNSAITVKGAVTAAIMIFGCTINPGILVLGGLGGLASAGGGWWWLENNASKMNETVDFLEVFIKELGG